MTLGGFDLFGSTATAAASDIFPSSVMMNGNTTGTTSSLRPSHRRSVTFQGTTSSYTTNSDIFASFLADSSKTRGNNTPPSPTSTSSSPSQQPHQSIGNNNVSTTQTASRVGTSSSTVPNTAMNSATLPQQKQTVTQPHQNTLHHQIPTPAFFQPNSATVTTAPATSPYPFQLQADFSEFLQTSSTADRQLLFTPPLMVPATSTTDPAIQLQLQMQQALIVQQQQWLLAMQQQQQQHLLQQQQPSQGRGRNTPILVPSYSNIATTATANLPVSTAPTSYVSPTGNVSPINVRINSIEPVKVVSPAASRLESLLKIDTVFCKT